MNRQQLPGHQPNKIPIDTDFMLEKLKQADDITVFMHENAAAFSSLTLKDLINSLIKRHHLKKSRIIADSGINEVYFYEILSGKKKPSRDKLLALAIGMKLHLDECALLLRTGGVNELYPRNRRDAIIIFALSRKLNVYDLNDLLYEAEEPIL